MGNYIYIALAAAFVFVLPHFIHYLKLALSDLRKNESDYMSDQEIQSHALADVFTNLPKIIAGAPMYNYDSFVGPHVMRIFFGLSPGKYPEYLLYKALMPETRRSELIKLANQPTGDPSC